MCVCVCSRSVVFQLWDHSALETTKFPESKELLMPRPVLLLLYDNGSILSWIKMCSIRGRVWGITGRESLRGQRMKKNRRLDYKAWSLPYFFPNPLPTFPSQGVGS